MTKPKLTLLIAASLTVMAGATIAPSLPQMAKVFSEVPNYEFLTKLTLSLPAFVIAIFGPVVGWLIDRHGRIKILVASLVLYAIGGGSGWFLDDLYLILIGRGVLGISVAGSMTIVTTLVGDYFEGEERDRFMGLQSAAMAAGGIVFVGLGGVLADVGWRHPFLMYAFSFVVVPMVVFWLKEPARPTAVQKEQDKRNPEFPKIGWVIYLTAMVSMIVFYVVPVQLPFYLKDIGVEKNSLTGLAIMVLTISATLVALNYTRLKRHFSYQAIYSIMFFFFGAGYLTVYLTTGYLGVLLGMLIAGIGGGMMMTNTNLWLMDNAPPAIRGKVMGGLTFFIYLGQFLSPVTIQPLANRLSLNAVFGILGVLLLGLTLLFGTYAFIARKSVIKN